MKQNLYMLPVRCKGCNTMFDLWPILQEQEQASNLSDNHFARLLNQSFCPTCKKAVMMGLPSEQQLDLSEDTEDEETPEEATDNEIEMMLELE